jgi:predicted MFS family arabinose efflux permease
MTAIRSEDSINAKLFSLPVIVAALGYFVDVLDLILFNIVRVPSLKELGLSDNEISVIGTKILNYQQAGLLLGSIFWGIMGDKRGRLSVLFGSILLYSLVSIACGFVHDPDTYGYLRFIAGIGLAGELGAGLTLVSEILPKHLRGYGSSVVAGVGLFGPVVAYFMTQWFDWRTAYFIGGGLGVALLVMRVNVFESGMFDGIKKSSVSKGDFLKLFTDKKLFIRYLKCMGVGFPTYFVIGLLATFGNEFAAAKGIDGINPGQCVMFVFLGSALGDLFSGILSQWLQSRRKAIFAMMTSTIFFVLILFFVPFSSTSVFYSTYFCLGFSIGFIAMFLTVAAESFGTNYRATVTTTVANFVRATTLLTLPLFQMLKPNGVIVAASVVAVLCFGIGIISLYFIEETYGKNLDYTE